MLTVAVKGAHQSAHAMQGPSTTANSSAEAVAPHDTPCSPFEHHQDDDCDSCANCVCHASLTVQPLQLNHNPIILNLSTFYPFKHVPEVYLSKFIPPQIEA